MPPFKGHQRLVSSPTLHQPPVLLARPAPTASAMSNPLQEYWQEASAPALAGHTPSFCPYHFSSLVAESAQALLWVFHVSLPQRQCPQHTPAWGRRLPNAPVPEISRVTRLMTYRHPSPVLSALSWPPQGQCSPVYRLPRPHAFPAPQSLKNCQDFLLQLGPVKAHTLQVPPAEHLACRCGLLCKGPTMPMAHRCWRSGDGAGCHILLSQQPSCLSTSHSDKQSSDLSDRNVDLI